MSITNSSRAIVPRGWIVNFFMLSAVGCPQATSPRSSERLQAARVASPLDAGPPPDAGPQPIPGARLFVGAAAGGETGVGAAAGADGGLADAGPTAAGQIDLSVPDASVPDSATLAFTAAVALEDFRARLLTDDDRLVPNHAESWVSDAGTTVALQPTPYWPSRGCCRFVVDGQVEKLPTGSNGRWLPFEVDFSVVPDPGRVRPADPVRPGKRHHRRRR
jgi:hypothetical protein